MMWAKSWQTPLRASKAFRGAVETSVASASYVKSRRIRPINSVAAATMPRPGGKLARAYSVIAGVSGARIEG